MPGSWTAAGFWNSRKCSAPHPGHGMGSYSRVPGGDSGKQRGAVFRLCQKSHPGLSSFVTSAKYRFCFCRISMGFIVGSQYERLGITKDGHKMVNAVSHGIGAQVYRGGRGLFWRGQLRHVRPGLFPRGSCGCGPMRRSGLWAGPRRPVYWSASPMTSASDWARAPADG